MSKPKKREIEVMARILEDATSSPGPHMAMLLRWIQGLVSTEEIQEFFRGGYGFPRDLRVLGLSRKEKLADGSRYEENLGIIEQQEDGTWATREFYFKRPNPCFQTKAEAMFYCLDSRTYLLLRLLLK